MTCIYHAQKLPHNTINTKTTGSMVLSQENKHTFLSPVKHLQISPQKKSISFAFSLLGWGENGFYPTSTQEQSLKFKLKKKSQSNGSGSQ